MLFDPTNYQLPNKNNVDWIMTKKNLSIFLSEYKNIREKLGLRATPKLKETYSLIHNENVSKEMCTDELYEEFVYLHKMFIHGYLSINHPFKTDITERRRKIFLLRFFYGLTILLMSDRIHYQRNVIIDDSNLAIIQFTKAINLLVMKVR